MYDYFSSGKLETFSLRDQDIINVPNYENRVFVNGEFKTTGIFETKINDFSLPSAGQPFSVAFIPKNCRFYIKIN